MSNNDPNINLPNPSPEEDEIDLIALAKTLWNGRNTVIKFTLIFMALGLFIAIFSPKEYTASTTILPQTQGGTKLGGSLGGLAAMAGIDLSDMSGSNGDISPLVYPQIVSGKPFQLALLKTPLNIKDQDSLVTYQKYYTDIYSPGLLGYLKKYTIGLPGLIIKALKGKKIDPDSYRNGKQTTNNSLITLTDDENNLIKGLSSKITIDVNKKEGYITIRVNMPEAKAAAQLTYQAQQLLQAAIIDFKIQKSSEQLKFIEARYTEKQKEFKTIQQTLANFRDRNQNMSTAIAQSQLQNIQSEYDLAYGVYSELAKKLETQQIRVKEDTPVFTVIQPVSVPIEKSKPNRPMILFIWTFLGGIVGVGMVFGKDYFGTLKEKWSAE